MVLLPLEVGTFAFYIFYVSPLHTQGYSTSLNIGYSSVLMSLFINLAVHAILGSVVVHNDFYFHYGLYFLLVYIPCNFYWMQDWEF